MKEYILLAVLVTIAFGMMFWTSDERNACEAKGGTLVPITASFFERVCISNSAVLP
jgi:hypothetical protein